jgi:hypothetical protein
MSDFDTDFAELHDTLHSPPGFAVGSLDLEHIMRSGTRRRRRITAARAATVVAALVVIAGGLQTTGILDGSHRGAPPAVTVTVPPTPASIVETGLKAGADGDWVIKTVEVDVYGSAEKTFGFSISERDKDGKLTKDDVISEVDAGQELKPGFHAVEHPYGYDKGDVQPAYGYFVGTPAKITGTVDGRTVTARMTVMATTQARTSVVVFWFDNTTVDGDSTLTRVQAYDPAGQQLAQARVYSEGE